MPSPLSRKPVHLLIVSHDVVKKNMAGPGIRYWELANVLARRMEVTLAVPGETDLGSETVRLRTYEPRDEAQLLEAAEASDIIFGTQDLLHRFPRLSGLEKPLIVDLYTPALLENLELHRHLPMPDRQFRHQNELAIMLDSGPSRGFLCLCNGKTARLLARSPTGGSSSEPPDLRAR